MKRWLLVSLVALAIVVLISPGIIGHLAERAIEEQIDYAGERDPTFAVATASFERGWFTSAGQHRIPLADADLAELVLALGETAVDPGTTPVLVIDTRLDHGLVPISAAGRELSALLPAMASGVSTLHLELSPGHTVDLPGSLHSRIGISGNAQFNYRLPAGSSAVAGHNASWEGADLKLTSSPDGRRLSADMRFDQWALVRGDDALSFDTAILQSSAEMTGWGFAIGDFKLVARNGRFTSASVEDAGFAELSVSMTSALRDERMHGSLNADVTGLRVTGLDSTVRLRSSVDDLDALHLGAFLRRLNDLAETAGEPGALGVTDLEFEARRLLSAGATINLQELRITSGQDEFLASMEFKLPRNAEAQAWVSLLLALQGNAEFEIPLAALESGAEMAEQLQPLIAAGFLVRKGSVYRMSAAYAKGLATINGVPMPVPMPGLQLGGN